VRQFHRSSQVVRSQAAPAQAPAATKSRGISIPGFGAVKSGEVTEERLLKTHDFDR
jgi:hypothetical protein